MRYPPRHHYGNPTPTKPTFHYNQAQIKAALPSGLRDRIPDKAAVLRAIQDAPHAGDLPEPMGKCIDDYHLRIPLEIFSVFEEKRDGLARGAALRRIIHWRWGT